MITPKGVKVTGGGVQYNSRHEVDPSRFGVDQEGVEVTIEGDGAIISALNGGLHDWDIKEGISLQWLSGL